LPIPVSYLFHTRFFNIYSKIGGAIIFVGNKEVKSTLCVPWKHIIMWKYRSLILLGTRHARLVSFMHKPLYPQGRTPRYQLNRSLGQPHSWSGCFGVETNFLYLQGIELWILGCQAPLLAAGHLMYISTCLMAFVDISLPAKHTGRNRTFVIPPPLSRQTDLVILSFWSFGFCWDIRLFSSPKGRDRLWGSTVARGSLPCGEAAESVKLDTGE